jgi:hypothetical protein
LAALLFGSLDLDNVDNVVRMAWALGLKAPSTIATDLALGLSASREGILLLSKARLQPAVEQWAQLRRRVYEILVFDPSTVASQACLSEAIEIALKVGFLSEHDWCLYDELLIERLRSHTSTKRLISRDYLGETPRLIYALQVRGGLADYQFASRAAAKTLISGLLVEQFPKAKALAYAFVDHGAFEKRLDFVDPDNGEPWSVGDNSRSVVLYGFSRTGDIPTAQAAMAVNRLKSKIGVREDSVLRCVLPNAKEEDEVGDQPQLTLPAF